MAAAVQYEPVFGAKEANIAALTRLINEAALAGARLVVLPEMVTTGYCFRDRAEIGPLVEPVPGGATANHFEALAVRHSIYLVAGLAEVDPATGVYYNTAVLLGPHGFIGKYRKTHAYIDDTRWSRDGDLGIPVFETELGRIALLICMDMDYPETGRVAALDGADVICFPTNWLGPAFSWYARAIENRVFVVAANRWGEERGSVFCGHSAVIDPDGHALGLLSTGDGLAAGLIDLDRARDKRVPGVGDLFAMRRPSEYHEMVLSSYLWHPAELRKDPIGREVVVGLCQTTDPARVEVLARWLDCQVRDRGGEGADLICLPPLPYESGLPHTMAELAAGLNCHLIWAMPEDRRYQTVWLAGPGGLEGCYRQVHVDEAIGSWAQPGDLGFPVFDLPWGRIGLLSGADLYMPEAARILAKRGADLIVAPTQSIDPDHLHLLTDRWRNNDTPLVVASPSGSAVLHGGARAELGAVPGATAWTVVDTANGQVREKELLRKLQPRWYDPIIRAGGKG